jgi:ketosteroid isomerase-like protein
MSPEEMERLFERHRRAEAARDFDAILSTFVEDCFLETHSLGLRSEGRAAARTAYEAYFTAFPDLAPDDEGVAFGKDVMVVRGTLRVRAVETGSGCHLRGAPLRCRLRTSLHSATG